MRMPAIARIPVMMGIVIAAVAASAPSFAVVTFADLPTNNSTRISFHNTTGPILADDFVPAFSGLLNQIEWWGTAATSTSWELAFHTNAASGQPNIDSSFQGALQKYMVTAVGVADASTPAGLFHYTANLTGPLVMVTAGQEFWFTAANSAPGWSWADALNGPVVGSENFNAHSSVGGAGLCGDGGPHCGPWVDVHTDLAFRAGVVPEPGTWALLMAGLAVVGLTVRGRNSA